MMVNKWSDDTPRTNKIVDVLEIVPKYGIIRACWRADRIRQLRRSALNKIHPAAGCGKATPALEAIQSPGTSCQPASVFRVTEKNTDFVRVTKLRARRAGTGVACLYGRAGGAITVLYARYVVILTHRWRLTPWLAVWRFAGELQEMFPDSRAAQSASCSLPSARILLRPPGEAAIGRRSAMPYPK